MDLMNKDQVQALFDKESVLLGTVNMVPEFRAELLFGKEAIEHTRRLNGSRPGYYVNGYGGGDYTILALTYPGFQAAASFSNVQLLRSMKKG